LRRGGSGSKGWPRRRGASTIEPHPSDGR
jgi:hypothetical protein